MTMPPQLSLMIQRNNRLCPNAIGSVFAGRRKTWGELAGRIARIAGGLRALGLEPGDRVAMLALNSDRYLEFFFATSWAGLVFVPINIRLAPPEVVHWLADSGAKALIVDDTFAKMVPALTPHLPDLNHLIHATDGAPDQGMTAFEALAEAAAIDASPRCGMDMAGLFYTGGTTGVSKGVMLSHANLINNAMIEITTSNSMSVNPPLSGATFFIFITLQSLSHGGLSTTHSASPDTGTTLPVSEDHFY